MFVSTLPHQVLVCTLSMLCSEKLHNNLINGRAVVRLLVDEASQVYLGDYLPHLHWLEPTIRYVPSLAFQVQPFSVGLGR